MAGPTDRSRPDNRAFGSTHSPDRNQTGPPTLDRHELELAVAVARTRTRMASLRLGSWTFARNRLILQIHQRRRRDQPRIGRDLGAGLIAVPALVTDAGVSRVGPAQLAAWGRSAEEVVAAARANTRAQSIHLLSATVTGGADTGAHLLVITGGPGTAGLMLDLDQVMGSEGPTLAAPLAISPDPAVLVVGQPSPGATLPHRQALAHRLVEVASLGNPSASLGPVIRFRGPGRLAIFNNEDLPDERANPG